MVNVEELTDQVKGVANEIIGVKEKLENLRITENVTSSMASNLSDITARNEAMPNASADFPRHNLDASTSSHSVPINDVIQNGRPNIAWPSHLLSEIVPPSFENEESDDPKAFISGLQEYLTVKGIPEEYKMAIVRKCFKGNAANWLELSVGNNNDFGTFVNLFLSRYWGATRQANIRLELSNGKYNSRVDQSMVNYFMKIARKSKMLDPPMSEKDLISLVTTHFPETIQHYLIIAKPSTVTEMIELLLALQSQKPRNEIEQRNYGRNEFENRNYFGQGATFNHNKNHETRNRYRGPIPRMEMNRWENRSRNNFDRNNKNQYGRQIRINYINTDRFDKSMDTPR